MRKKYFYHLVTLPEEYSMRKSCGNVPKKPDENYQIDIPCGNDVGKHFLS
jgi:hypothetical protein